MDSLFNLGVALVTGAGSGMGQVISVQFVKEGVKKILLADINEKGLETTKDLIAKVDSNAQVLIHKTDISKESECANMVATCAQKFGRLDFAVNCAGLGRGGKKSADMSLQDFEFVFGVNQKGVFFCEKHEIAQMLKQEPLPAPHISSERLSRGSIVHIASLCSTVPFTELSAYVSSKHAVLGFTRGDARDFAKEGIRINCVSPGFVNTPMVAGANLSQEYIDSVKAQSPMNRMTHSEEVSEAVIFLSSSRASGITGSNLYVDAGANTFHTFP